MNVVSSNICIGPLPRIRISFFLLSACADELISTPKIMTFLPDPLLSDNVKLSLVSDTDPYSQYLYLSRSAFLVSLTANNKEFLNVNLVAGVYVHKFIS